MNKTIGVCGYSVTGSSAYSDFLREFNEVQVLDLIEFGLVFFPDGLEDLEYHVKNYHKYASSVVAINRFRNLIKKTKRLKTATKGKINTLTDDFLNKIIQVSWNGTCSIDKIILSPAELFFKKCFFQLGKKLRLRFFYKLYLSIFPTKMELSIMPDNFDTEAKNFVSEILNLMGRDINRITVLDQPFEGCNPVKSFKFFDNPKAIVVARDPRDHYLFVKLFLQKRGEGYQIPCDNVDNYIKYFRQTHLLPKDLKNREDVIFFNFEELIYDYENTAKKTAEFAGVTQHIHKGEFFKPSHSRNNTQLFRKFSGYEADIKKIERELPEYLFPFEKYPDITPEGGMFFGSQSNKKR